MNVTVHIQVRRLDPAGDCACGIVVRDDQTLRPVHEAGYFLGRDLADDDAHYHALVRALELLLPLRPNVADLCCGRQSLIDQITGLAPLTSASARPILQQVQQLLLRLDGWKLTLQPPDAQPQAQDLARQALDEEHDVSRLSADESAQQFHHEHTGVPQWTLEILEDAGPRCPGKCRAGERYAFGPDTPASLCVYAAEAALADGPLHWPDPTQERMTTVCAHCHTPLRIQLVI